MLVLGLLHGMTFIPPQPLPTFLFYISFNSLCHSSQDDFSIFLHLSFCLGVLYGSLFWLLTQLCSPLHFFIFAFLKITFWDRVSYIPGWLPPHYVVKDDFNQSINQSINLRIYYLPSSLFFSFLPSFLTCWPATLYPPASWVLGLQAYGTI